MTSMPPTQTAEPPKKKSNVVMIIVLALCLGGCLCVGVVGAILFPVFAHAKEAAITSRCAISMREVGDAVDSYMNEKGEFPATIADVKDRISVPTETLKCPKIERAGHALGFAYNAPAFASKKLDDLTDETINEQPVLIEILDPAGDDLLNPASKFPKRHNNGRYVNAYYPGRGVVRLRLTDAQMEAPIMSVIKELRPASTPTE